jgi:hypothetical protein
MSDLLPADAAKLFAKSGITVRMPKTDKAGGRVKDAGGNFLAEDRPLAAEHIVAVRDLGATVRIVTADGGRYDAAKPVK